MIDTQTLKERYDLRRIVEQDLGPAPVAGRRRCLWKCPFHHERKGYSLVGLAEWLPLFWRVPGTAVMSSTGCNVTAIWIFCEAVRLLEGGYPVCARCCQFTARTAG